MILLVAGLERDLAAREQPRGLLADDAQSSKTTAATSARRCGSADARGHSIDGPECSSVRGLRSASIASRAATTAIARGDAEQDRDLNQ